MNDDQVEYIQGIVSRSIGEARRASRKFPQPNKVLLKVAEEAGAVVKSGVHLCEGRDFTRDDLEGEVVQTIAMCFRLLIEGDGTIDLPATYQEQ